MPRTIHHRGVTSWDSTMIQIRKEGRRGMRIYVECGIACVLADVKMTSAVHRWADCNRILEVGKVVQVGEVAKVEEGGEKRYDVIADDIANATSYGLNASPRSSNIVFLRSKALLYPKHDVLLDMLSKPTQDVVNFHVRKVQAVYFNGNFFSAYAGITSSNDSKRMDSGYEGEPGDTRILKALLSAELRIDGEWFSYRDNGDASSLLKDQHLVVNARY
ncbi:hypothetical protein EDD18DRAFT_1109035 [Armillaria luteobubalina]|uniref:Uncharacterized protein n=1 Tax=Armillaria luteobubalina TaxID=153913 RepID=A0AA39PXB5_9AGAR|nr:hypothetical protein EDD18DRAFT_1109035 [Armillaria luteobubalina]